MTGRIVLTNSNIYIENS